MDDLRDRCQALEQRLEVLDATRAVRACLGRYFDLCDVPGPFSDPGTREAALAELADLFTPDASWEGIGPAYAGKFGAIQGRSRVAAHVAAYLPPADHFRSNAHLVGSEQIHIAGDKGHGQWLMQQLSHYADGSADLLCARIRVETVLTRGAAGMTAQMSRFTTERLYAAELVVKP